MKQNFIKKILLYIFLIGLVLYIIKPILFIKFGIRWGYLPLIPAILSLFCMRILYEREKTSLRVSSQWAMAFKGFRILLIVLFVWGGIRGNNIYVMVQELVPLWILLSFFDLGRYDQFWNDLMPVAVWGTLVGFILIFATSRIQEVNFNYGVFSEGVGGLERYFIEGTRAETQSIGYQMWSLVGLWPILFGVAILSRERSKLRWISYLFPGLYLATCLLFTKRAPTARGMLYVVLFVYFFPMALGKVNIRRSVVIGLTAILCLLFVGQAYFDTLVVRFQTKDYSRFEEAQSCIVDLGVGDSIIGRGLGGEFVPHSGWKAGINLRGMRTALHIGILVPYLKGGISYLAIFLIIFILPSFSYKDRKWKENPFNIAAQGTVWVVFLFFFIEGFVSHSNIPFAMLLGMSSARMYCIE